MAGPALIALTKLGELRNRDIPTFQALQELQDQVNQYIMAQAQAALVGSLAAGYVKSVGVGSPLVSQAAPIPVADGGTGTMTAFTQGSIVFAGAAGAYTQDNAGLFWNDASNFLGINTATPAHALDVVGKVGVRGVSLNLANGANQDVVLTSSFISFITGVTGAFSFGGIAGGADGQLVVVANRSGLAMTVNHEDLGSAAANRFNCDTGANVLCANGFFEARWSLAHGRWLLLAR
jgi:hypothetical protein